MKIKEILPRQKRRHAHDTVEESLRFVDVPARSRRVKVTSHSKNKNKPKVLHPVSLIVIVNWDCCLLIII